MESAFAQLRRDRSALLLSLVVPVAFFSIFAWIFGGQQNPATAKVSVIVVDEDHSAASQRLVKGLEDEGSLNAFTHPEAKKGEPAPPDYTAASAEAAVKAGDAPAAIIIPKGFGTNPINFGRGSQTKLRLLHDSSDPVAAPMISGLLQEVAMTSLSDLFAEQGMKYFDKAIGGLTPVQNRAVQDALRDIRKHLEDRQKAQSSAHSSGTSKPSGANPAFNGPVAVDVHDVVGEKKKNPMVSFEAAAITVMFLLFSAVAAAGTLLEESESGALDRILSARVSMTQLLTGKLLYGALVGVIQLVAMFVWAALAFHLELFSHLAGFFVMTIPTALAASAFGLLLATVSRSRAAQHGFSTLIILTMSAVGGSMFPRFLMPPFMLKLGLLTYNAWAIDGYTKIFWRDEPASHTLPQVAFLLGWTIVLFAIARRFARKWEYA